ncbi:hypothetical protein A9Q98_01550 [Thalassotalea sp. 42_200_T64]|nr:hypothetical protein A9Q98_01550 [Thalassotalea sp. 42_200_T64]
MKITDTLFKNIWIIIGAALLGLFFFDWYTNNEFKHYLLLLSIYCICFAYRFTQNYITKNSLMNLIKRHGEIIEVSRLKTVPFSNKSARVSLDVNRISKVTVSNNLLSIIIDGNGNGYDFQLIGSNSHINKYFRSLFNENELSGIDIRCI